MPLKKTLLEIPLVGQLRTDVSARIMPKGMFEEMVNARNNPTGELTKRPGSDALLQTTTAQIPGGSSTSQFREGHGLYGSENDPRVYLAGIVNYDVFGDTPVVLPWGEQQDGTARGWGSAAAPTVVADSHPNLDHPSHVSVNVGPPLGSISTTRRVQWIGDFAVTTRFFFVLVKDYKQASGTYDWLLYTIDRETQRVVDYQDLSTFSTVNNSPAFVIAGESAGVHTVALVYYRLGGPGGLETKIGTIDADDYHISWNSTASLVTPGSGGGTFAATDLVDCIDWRDNKSNTEPDLSIFGVLVYVQDGGAGSTMRLILRQLGPGGWGGEVLHDTGLGRTVLLYPQILLDETTGNKRPVAYQDSYSGNLHSAQIVETAGSLGWATSPSIANGVALGATRITGGKVRNQDAPSSTAAYWDIVYGTQTWRGGDLATNQGRAVHPVSIRNWPGASCGLGPEPRFCLQMHRAAGDEAVFSEQTLAAPGLRAMVTRFGVGDSGYSAGIEAPNLSSIPRTFQIEGGVRVAPIWRTVYDRTAAVATVGQGDFTSSLIEIQQFRFKTPVPRLTRLAQPAMGGGHLVTLGSRVLPVTMAPPEYAVSKTPGASGLAAGTYGAMVIAYLRNDQGELIRSRPWYDTIAIALDDTILVTMDKTPAETWGVENEVAYELFLMSPTTAGLYYSHSFKQYDCATWTQWAIGSSDVNSAIAAAVQPYTAGGIPATAPAPPSAALATTGTRIFLLDASNRRLVWPSHPKEPDLSWEWSFETVLEFPEELVTIVVLDGRLIGFSKGAIYTIAGVGPNRAGYGTFTPPERISGADGVGCIDANSVVMTPAGLVFRSPRGYELLDRSLQVQSISQAVTGLPTTTTRSIFVPPEQECRLYQNNNTALVKSFREGDSAWMKWTPASVEDAILPGGENPAVHTLHPGAYVRREGTGFTDFNTSYIDRDLTTGWIHLENLTGFLRLYRVTLFGMVSHQHVLNIEVFYDGNETVAETFQKIFTGASSSALLQFRPARQKCSAVKFRIYESNSAGTAAASWTALGLEIGYKGKNPVDGASRLGGTT